MESQSWAEATDIEQYLVMSLEILPKIAPPEIILLTSEANSRADTKRSLKRILSTDLAILLSRHSEIVIVPLMVFDIIPNHWRT